MDPIFEFDDVDDGYFDINSDDEQARRLLSLAVEFMNARGPLTSSDIERFYPDLTPESRNRAFFRDRNNLTLCGIVIERDVVQGVPVWRVNESRSFAAGPVLTEREALLLDIACVPLVNDPEFPMRDELRIALAKIDHAFSGGAATRLVTSTARDNRNLATLRSCMAEGIAAKIRYTRADGETSERTIAPYGFFGLRGKTYMVGPRVDKGGTPEPGSMRTYLVDRVGSAEAQPKIAFEVPADFAIEDWRRLPFQIGPTVCTCEFLVPESQLAELARESLGHGSISRDERGTVWTVDAASERDAASWAIAHGIRPLAPKAVVDAWREVLTEVIAHA